jgi:hypothetical protein
MAKFGNDYRLWIESSTPGTFHEIKGQQDLEEEGTAQTYDTSSKDNFPYATSAPGLRSLNLSLTLLPDPLDTNGYGRLEAVARGLTTQSVKFQIRKDGAGGTAEDVVLEAPFYISNFSRRYPQNGSVSISLQLLLAGPPTVDTLK